MASNPLNIAVLGAGNIGGTLGRKWVTAGHHVTFGVSDPNGAKARKLRADLGDAAKIGTTAEALAAGEIVVFAVPGGAMDEIISTYARQLDGRVIVDTANRMGGGTMNSVATFKQHTPNAKVFRAFNSLGWENFADTDFGGVQADLFYAGPDGEPGAAVEQLISDIGLHPVRLGDSEQAGLVDSVASLWFALALGQHKGRHLAFKVLSR
jgi:predicted dinucleotide-binding enzyme